MSNIAPLINELKLNNQDFEFYPTTDEIIDVIKQDMFSNFTSTSKYKKTFSKYSDIEKGLFLSMSISNEKISILDIGAGNGQTLNKLASFLNGFKFNDVYYSQSDVLNYDSPTSRELKVQKYAIEKSSILAHGFKANNINFVGSDFFETSLSKFDVIFCNPPYSNYKLWINNLLNNIIGQPVIYLVIPSLWKEDNNLNELFKKQNVEITILDSFDFLQADRVARVNVDVLKLKVLDSKNPLKDSIQNLFKQNFKEDIKDELKFEQKENKQNLINLNKQDYPTFICNEYNKEINSLNSALTEISKISLSSLETIFGLDLNGIVYKFSNLKSNVCNKYWNLIIDKVCTIEKRLIKRHRTNLLSNIIDKNLDFNLSNIYYIIEQIVSITSEKLNEQVLDVYNELLVNSPVEKYKSNKRIFSDNDTELKDQRVKLTPRIILELGYWNKAIETDWQNKPTNKLSGYAIDKINDILIVIKSLGFETSFNPANETFEKGKTKSILGTFNGKEINILDLKAFLNGNLHIKLNKDILIKFNIVKGILEGWVNSASEIMDEFEVNEEQAINALNFKKINFNLLN